MSALVLWCCRASNSLVGLDEEKLVAVLEARGHVQTAELAGLQRRVIIGLARSLKREVSDFDQAVAELERAVEIALEVIARGERGTNTDELVDKVLSQIAEKTRHEDFDGGARAVDDALAELDRREAEERDAARRARVALLEAGVRQDTLRRDAVAVAGRIAALVAVPQPTDRPAWLPEFRKHCDAYYEDGDAKGINFSLSVAIELARLMLATAGDDAERGIAANLLGNALSTLGERESGTARLEEAVDAYRAALEEWTSRSGAARLGDDAEQPRHRASRRSGNGRAGRRVWRRRSPPTARRWRSGLAIGCRSTGR